MYYILAMLQRTISFLLLMILTACSGYRFVENDNPLAIHGIRSVSVPMFVNKSALPNIGATVSKEIVLLLSSYPGLKVTVGENLNSDAILVGIINSSQHLSELLITTDRKFTSGDLKTSIGGRQEFYVPIGTSVTMQVRFVLIKNPNAQDLEMAKGDLSKFMPIHPNVLMDQTMNMTTSFTRVVGNTVDADSPGLVNLTKNKAILDRALEDGSKSLANQFKDVVLNAF